MGLAKIAFRKSLIPKDAHLACFGDYGYVGCECNKSGSKLLHSKRSYLQNTVQNKLGESQERFEFEIVVTFTGDGEGS